jgi:hypothetical protein
MSRPQDDPQAIADAQDRIAAAISQADGVSYSICEACGGTIMYVYSVHGGWLWIAAGAQAGTPPAQCPDTPGYYDIGHGAHRPASFTTGDING